MSTNIRTLLKAKTVLFIDSEYYNKEITGVKNLEDIKSMFSIRGKLTRKAFYGNCVVYKLVDSDYEFTLKFID